MRAQKAILSILFFFILIIVPTFSYALTVTANGQVIGEGVGFVDLNNAPAPGGFTITTSSGSGGARAEQSGSLVRIVFTDLIITAPPEGGSLTITASSGPGDFPTNLPPGPYPGGVVMAGLFTPGADATVDGNTVSVTGFGPNVQVINFVPGPGDADTPISLPSFCSGSFCTFTASAGNDLFIDLVAEDIQLECPGFEDGDGNCTPVLSINFEMNLVNAGSGFWIFPGSAGSLHSRTGSPAAVIAALQQFTFATFSANLDIHPLTSIKFDGSFNLNANTDGINPLAEDVTLLLESLAGTPKIPPVSFTIPKGSFRQIGKGKFVFQGSINGSKLQAEIDRVGAGFRCTIQVEVTNMPFVEPWQAGIFIGNDKGFDKLIARLVKN
jgi:hypothetical protein